MSDYLLVPPCTKNTGKQLGSHTRNPNCTCEFPELLFQQTWCQLQKSSECSEGLLLCYICI